ncbi:MAG: SWIM zinc finger family protein [Thermoguttaceae bacterium]|nr:SWIM zinc finger family protein [Thermoguttaceae bacterium]
MQLTTEQIDALAPDSASIAAGRKLATATWKTLGGSERALWGEIYGSGKSPYQTIVDLRSIAYKCSCPSRKIPCKHALGLLYRAAKERAVDDSEPDWVVEWLDARDEREKKAQIKATEKKDKKPSKASEKTAEKRKELVADGLEQLKTWLSDSIRVGVDSLDPNEFWKVSKRMIDAKAPGVAAMLTGCAEGSRKTDDWREKLLGKLGKIALLIEAYGRIDKATEDFASELRQTIGWTIPQANVLESGERVVDKWISVGQYSPPKKIGDRVLSKRSWFLGAESRRFALYLQYSAGQQGEILKDYPEGFARLESAARFYPGVVKTRALWEPLDNLDFSVEQAALPADAAISIPEMFARYAQALAKYPWTQYIPVLLADVVVRPNDVEKNASQKKQWRVVDQSGRVLPAVFDDPTVGWQAVASSASKPVVLFGEWDGSFFLPLSLWIDGKRVCPLPL